MKKLIIASAVLFSISSQYALANNYKTTIEYRHQYLDASGKSGDRIKAFLDTGKNIGFELDARYGNKDGAYDAMKIDGSEFSAFYYTKLNPNLVGLVGASLDFDKLGLVYVPYVRLNYTFDNGIRLQGRYKWKVWDYGQVGENGSNYHSKIQEFDSWIGYKWGNLDLQYQLDLMWEMADNAQPLYNDNKFDYQHNVRLRYDIKADDGALWRPFVEVGNVKENRFSSDRQTRFRVGIQYTW